MAIIILSLAVFSLGVYLVGQGNRYDAENNGGGTLAIKEKLL